VSSIRKGEERSESLKWLAIFVAVTLALWHSPLAIVLYPFTLLATWFHEMGHGLAGMMVGAEFVSLVILPDGSGYTTSLHDADMSRSARAFISAGGPLGPAIAGGALIIASRWRKGSVWALVLLAGALLASALLVVDGLTGWIVLPALALVLLGIARFASIQHRQLALKFCGIQGCISTYVSLDYVFSRGGVMVAGAQYSDTEQMAQALFLPYWFWGLVLTAMIIAIIAFSLWIAYRR